MYCLFDFDGTLFDTSDGIIRSAKYALEKMGIQYSSDQELAQKFIGPPLHDTFMEHYGLTESEATVAVSFFRSYYRDNGMFMCKLYDGIKDLLKELSENRVMSYVATSKPTVFTNEILQRFGLKQYFRDVVGSNLDGTKSSKVEIITYLLEKNEITDLTNVYMIGDKKQDMIGAYMTGVQFIGVLYGFGSQDEFLPTCMLCTSVKELSDRIVSLAK